MAMELRVARRFRVAQKIGSGSFGDIYAGKVWRFNVTLLQIIVNAYFYLKEQIFIRAKKLLLNWRP